VTRRSSDLKDPRLIMHGASGHHLFCQNVQREMASTTVVRF
jgi:hypothetical protein